MLRSTRYPIEYSYSVLDRLALRPLTWGYEPRKEWSWFGWCSLRRVDVPVNLLRHEP